jgi:hypothetical protein
MSLSVHWWYSLLYVSAHRAIIKQYTLITVSKTIELHSVQIYIYYILLWECHHVCLYVYTLHHHCEARGTIWALLEPAADDPEKGRIVYGEFLGPDTGAAGAGG